MPIPKDKSPWRRTAHGWVRGNDTVSLIIEQKPDRRTRYAVLTVSALVLPIDWKHGRMSEAAEEAAVEMVSYIARELGVLMPEEIH